MVCSAVHKLVGLRPQQLGGAPEGANLTLQVS